MDIQIYEKIRKEFRKYYNKDLEKLNYKIENIELNNEKYSEIINYGDIILYKKINVKGKSELDIKVDLGYNKYLVLFEEVEIDNNSEFRYNIRGRIKGILYHYIFVNHGERSLSNLDERFSLYGKLYNISIINIEKGSKHSEGYLNEMILDNGFLMSLPILNIKDESSKGFHGIKNIKLDNEQIFYLSSKGIKGENLSEIIEKSILE